MDHSLPLISTLVIAFSLALVFGFIAERVFRSPALVGYLLAGIAAGKYTPGVVADAALASQLSEIGVMLLMFGVGLHFSLKDLWSVKSVAVPGAVLQMTIATVLGACFAHWFFDRHWAEAIVLGVSLSCASTVVLLKALDVRGKLTSPDGRIAVGWLVVEDIATVLILVLLPPFANLMMPGTPGASTRLANADILWMIGQTLFNAALFVAVMLVVGRRVLPWAMGQVARTGSRELFTLFVLAAAVGVAYGASEIFHVSFALGAFFAGMVMRESRFAHRAATESLPLQDAFSVLFFVGVGMLFDWHILLESPLEVLTVLLIILFGKSIGAFGLVYFMRYPLNTAMIAAVALAQIGEFSFILIGQAVELGLADMSTVNLVVAGAILSIALNPGLFWAEPHISRWLTSRFAWARRAAMRHAPYESLPADTEAEKLQGQAVVAGSGPLLDRLAVSLEESGIPVVAVSSDEANAKALDDRKISVVLGDPSTEETWIHAHLHNAKLLVLLESGAESLRIAEAARRVSPNLPIVVAATSRGIWPEVKMEKVTFLSTVEASARLISAQTAAAMRADITLGNPVCKGDVEAAAAEAARQSEAQARAEAGPGADTTDEMEGAAAEDAAEADAQEAAAQKSAKWSFSRLSGLNKLKGVFKRSKPAAADQPTEPAKQAEAAQPADIASANAASDPAPEVGSPEPAAPQVKAEAETETLKPADKS